jgi:LemA protein
MLPARLVVLARAFGALVLLFTATVLGGATLAGCQSYDALVAADQVCQQKWGDVEANLQRRADLVPNLVATVKASAQHEESTLSAVTQARAQATQIKLSADDLTDPAKMAAFQQAQGQLSSALSKLLVTNEAYPDLKANAQFHDLQVQLEGTENRILRAREDYNASVGTYNTELGKVRGAVTNKVTGQPFKPRQDFSATPDSQVAPKVSF